MNSSCSHKAMMFKVKSGLIANHFNIGQAIRAMLFDRE